MSVLLAILSFLLLGDPARDTVPYSQRRPVSTYSIVARDPATGELGVAVQSHWFGVGSLVAWAEAGVGAVATQSFVEPGYGPRGLALMRSGVAAPDALVSLLLRDGAKAVRQVAFVDAQGRVGAHTGEKCIRHASHRTGKGYSVQANMMMGDKVVGAMAEAYERTTGDLGARLLAALEAAEREGGDIRGRQAAAIVVVKGTGTGRPWADRVLDLRVEDHKDPVAELRRLFTLQRAYAEMNAGDLAIERGDQPGALSRYEAASRLAPDNLEVAYWHALTLATNGKLEAARPIFRRVFAADPHWAELTRRLPRPEVVPAGAAGARLIQKILATAPAARR